MRQKPKAPTTAETLKYIQQNRIAYGADERARYVEHVCGLLLNDRFWPGASDDMFTIKDHAPQVAVRRCEVANRVSTTCGSGWGFFESRSCEVANGVSTACGSGWGFFESRSCEAAKCRKLGRSGFSTACASSLVRTGSRSDRVNAAHVQLLGHLNQTNAPPNGPPVLGRIALDVSSPHVSKGPPSGKELWDA